MVHIEKVTEAIELGTATYAVKINSLISTESFSKEKHLMQGGVKH